MRYDVDLPDRFCIPETRLLPLRINGTWYRWRAKLIQFRTGRRFIQPERSAGRRLSFKVNGLKVSVNLAAAYRYRPLVITVNGFTWNFFDGVWHLQGPTGNIPEVGLPEAVAEVVENAFAAVAPRFAEILASAAARQKEVEQRQALRELRRRQTTEQHFATVIEKIS